MTTSSTRPWRPALCSRGPRSSRCGPERRTLPSPMPPSRRASCGCSMLTSPSTMPATGTITSPTRPRKLLAHRNQIRELGLKASQKRSTLVPLRLYLRKGMAKLELGLGERARGCTTSARLWPRARAIGRSSAPKNAPVTVTVGTRGFDRGRRNRLAEVPLPSQIQWQTDLAGRRRVLVVCLLTTELTA